MRYQVFYILVLCLFQCHSDEVKVANRPPISSIQYEDFIDQINLHGSSSSDPDGDKLTFSWSSASGKIIIKDTNSSDAYFEIPAGNDVKKVDITLNVKDKTHTNESTLSIDVPALTQVRSFGLGKNLQAEVSADASRDWYLDQVNTGPYSSVNCGPTSTTMAIRWASETFMGTPEDARHTYRPAGGWWYTNDIINYLNDNQIKNWTIALNTMQTVKAEIDNGNIVILCLDMYLVNYSVKDKYRSGKFYSTDKQGWGHFIVIKGYKVVDNQTYFEVYDPYSFGKTYSDQSLKGKNRYYISNDLDVATQKWWDYAIIVSRNKSAGGRRGAIDDKTIVHMPGR